MKIKNYQSYAAVRWTTLVILCLTALTIHASADCPSDAFTISRITPNGNNGVGSVSAVYDGTNFLVAIHGNQVAANHISAQLVSATGTPISSPISVSRTGGEPLVAFDGTKYLMVWPDDARGDQHDQNLSVYGQFVSRAGALVGSPFVVSALPVGPIDETPTGISFDGNNYLIVYGIGTNVSLFTPSYNALAARFVSPAGEVGSEFTLASGGVTPNDGDAPFRDNTVACNGTHYLVTWWQHNSGNHNDVYGELVSKSGVVSAPFRISQNTSPDHNSIAVDSDGANFLVAWTYDTGTGFEEPPLAELHGRLVTASGGFGSAEFTVAGVESHLAIPALAFDGINYLFTWTTQSNTNDWNIAGQFITQTGALLGSAISLVTCPGIQAISPVVYGNGKDLVLWTDGFTFNGKDFSGTAIQGLFLTVAPTNATPAVTTPPFTGAQGLYDLTGVITGFDMVGTYHNTDYDLSAAVRVVQSITGAFTAGDTGTVLTVNANGNVDVPVVYTLKGALSAKGAKPTGTLNFSCKGTYHGGNNQTTTYHVSETLITIFTLDPVTGEVTGQTTGAFSKSPSKHGTANLSSVPLPPITLTPVDWSLSLTGLTMSGAKVTGGTATVNLRNGRIFPFTVKGTTSQLTLTGASTGGTDSAKGAKLTVTMTGSHITGIIGSLLGQKVNISGL